MNLTLPTLEEIQKLILEEDGQERQQIIEGLSHKYNIHQVKIFKYLKDLLGDEEYYKRFLLEEVKNE